MFVILGSDSVHTVGTKFTLAMARPWSKPMERYVSCDGIY